MSFAHAQDGKEEEMIRKRLGMGQYGLALEALLHCIRDNEHL